LAARRVLLQAAGGVDGGIRADANVVITLVRREHLDLVDDFVDSRHALRCLLRLRLQERVSREAFQRQRAFEVARAQPVEGRVRREAIDVSDCLDERPIRRLRLW